MICNFATSFKDRPNKTKNFTFAILFTEESGSLNCIFYSFYQYFLFMTWHLFFLPSNLEGRRWSNIIIWGEMQRISKSTLITKLKLRNLSILFEGEI